MVTNKKKTIYVYTFFLYRYLFSPFYPSNKEHQVAIDFGAVDKFVNVAGVHSLSCL